MGHYGPVRSTTRAVWIHIGAGAVFAFMALVWSYPLAFHLATHLPGPGAGDNIDFLWNFWWMRTALGSRLDVFSTPYLFAPSGMDLTLHTHTALPAFVGATMLRGVSIVTAQNLTILATLFLNGYCAFVLAWRLTRDHGAALLAGIVFSGSPYVAAHLNGHFNLIAAWTIPLFVLAASKAVVSTTPGAAIVAGLILGVTAYIDYYYVVYEAVLLLCLVAFAAAQWTMVVRGMSAGTRRRLAVVGALILLDLAILAAIAITGGFETRIGPLRISARDTFNPLQAFWILVAIFLWLRTRPSIEIRPSDERTARCVIRAVLIVAGVFLLAAAPLVWKGAALFLRGAYVSPPLFWRSSSKGVDLATLVLGNPFQGLWGKDVQSLYGRLGIEVIESTGWLGIVPLLLAGSTVRRLLRGDWRGTPASHVIRQWTIIGVAFFIWSLGPHLMAFGINTGMPLPQALLRYLPIVSNARVPGRAIVVSYLALAVLGAIAMAEWRRGSRRPLLILVVASLAVTVDFLPAPFPLVSLDRPPIYQILRDRPEPGAVCELPFGIRDGFGERGSFDDRVLFYQTIHQHALVGGFVGRMPRAIAAKYENDPLLSALLRLSSRHGARHPMQSLPGPELAANRLRENGIAFVVLNRETASPALTEYAERVLPLRLLVTNGDRSLYVVTGRD
jgi:hypothetical protein